MSDVVGAKGFTVENARALDRLLNEVPLDADEIREVEAETGIDAKRLAAKIKERIEREVR